MRNNKITLSTILPADINTCWRSITDWPTQSNWMLQTKVWTENVSSDPLTTTICAFTGPLHRIYPRFKNFGILDIMTIEKISAPHRCDVLHVGKIIQGSGTFKLEEISDVATRFIWSETIKAPRLVFILIKPAITVGVHISLRRLSRILAQ
jgi:hypothetical protein